MRNLETELAKASGSFNQAEESEDVDSLTLHEPQSSIFLVQ